MFERSALSQDRPVENLDVGVQAVWSNGCRRSVGARATD